MNPYEINHTKLKNSKKITDERDLLKLKLIHQLKEVMDSMETSEIIKITGLDKSDLSRLRVSSYQRFSIDRLIKIFDLLGFKTEVLLVKKKKIS